MKVKEDCEKAGLKLNIYEANIMASLPITSWQINGETMETVTETVTWAPKSPDCDCIHEIKRHLLLGRKAMNNLDSIFKSRDYFSNKGPSSETMAFPLIRYGYESFTMKKAEHQRIDAFELWYWRRFLRVSWTARRSIQSILKEISPEYSLERLMLKLKLQYSGHLM